MHYFLQPTKDLSNFFSSCKSHNQCKTLEAAELKKTISKLCFLRMSELHKLIFSIWMRRLQTVRPVNGFMVSFSSLQHISYKKTTRLTVNGLNFLEKPGRGRGVEVGSLERVSLILIYIFMNSFIYTVFNLQIMGNILWALQYANVSLRCRHLS